MKKIYPAIFTREDDGRYDVFFPDLQGCNTYGENIEHAALMAAEALGLYIESLIDHNMTIPIATNIETINKTLAANEFTSLIIAEIEASA